MTQDELKLIMGQFERLNTRFDALELSVASRFEAFEERINARFNAIETRLDELREMVEHLDAKIDIFNRELLDLKRKIRRDAA
jgi:chromosome segregation ATPase